MFTEKKYVYFFLIVLQFLNCYTQIKKVDPNQNIDIFIPLQLTKDDLTFEELKNYFETGNITQPEDTENFCATKYEKNASFLKDPKTKRVKRGIANVKRYIETLVVVDQLFLSYHKSINIEKYLLTICSQVNSYLQDPSLQQDIELVVVRIIYLKDDKPNFNITYHFQNTLDAFAKWAEAINFPENHSQHHDVAVLISRVDFCDNGDRRLCDVTGLSYVSGGCDRNKSVIVVEDKSLIKTSYFIVHELGHLLGANHDGEKSAINCTGSKNLMFPSTLFSNQIFDWSQCSTDSVEIFMDAGLGDCLNNKPESVRYSLKNDPPGTIFDRNQQCQLLQFQKSCNFKAGEVDPCTDLFCESGGICEAILNMVAEGTSCGKNMWCIGQKCISKNQNLTNVNGGWSTWLGWTECSRSCGGGVSTNIRICNNPAPRNRGKFCKGDKKKAKICNPQACVVGNNPKSFRQIQCDTKWKELKKYGLNVAGTNPEDPCGLYCRAEDSNEFVQLERFVKDGTDCGNEYPVKMKCVWGMCTLVGCDNQINSNATVDQCGKCMGDGKSCVLIEKIFGAIPMMERMLKVVEFPKNSSMIFIQELKSSMNAIVVTDRSGKNVYLNPNLAKGYQDSPGLKYFKNIEANYTVQYPFQERLFIYGPIDEELVFHIFFFEPVNVGYKYKYAISNTNAIYNNPA